MMNVIDKISNPQVLGELLREVSFQPLLDNQKNRLLGCYDHFEVRQEWKKVSFQDISQSIQELISESLSIDSNELTHVSIYRNVFDNMYMVYFWESDGILMYILPDNTFVINTNCKNSSTWEIYEID
jgi:hypothetical protein